MSRFIIMLSLLVVLGVGLSGCGGQGTESTALWAYAGNTGPAFWGVVKPEYAVCARGQAQSPVDIAGSFTSQELLPLMPSYEATATLVRKSEHSLVIDHGAGSKMNFEKRSYELTHIEFHVPSEHRLGGVSYPMEAQLFHKSEDGRILAISVLFNAGPENAFLREMLRLAPRKTEAVAVEAASKLLPKDLLPQDPSYFSYSGSLTAPPCTEGVRWLLLKQPRSLAWSQVDEFLAITGMNARPVQPLNGRHIMDYVP